MTFHTSSFQESTSQQSTHPGLMVWKTGPAGLLKVATHMKYIEDRQTEPSVPPSSQEQYNFVCEGSALASCIATKREDQKSLKEAKPEFSSVELSNLFHTT